MSAIKDGRYPIELKGKTYHLLFSLNALDALQDKFGGYDKLGEIFSAENKDVFKDLRWLLALLINEGLEDDEPQLTEQSVGKLIHLGNLGAIKDAIYQSFAYGINGGERTEEDAENDGENNGEETEGNAPSVRAE